MIDFNDDDLFGEVNLLDQSAENIFSNSNKKNTTENNKNSKTKKISENIENKGNEQSAGVVNNQNVSILNNNNLDNVENENILEQTGDEPLKNKKQKTNKKKKKISKWGVFGIVVLAVLVVGGAVLGGLYLKKINTKLATPVYEIYQYGAGTIIDVESVENATSYEFTIIQDGRNTAVFESNENVIELQSYLKQPGVFSVKIRALGKTSKATSDYSIEKQVTNFVKIGTPQIFKDGNTISWNPIKNATGYNLFYKVDENLESVQFLTIPQNEELITFDLQTLNEFGAGLYPICVQAITDISYYVNGDFSNTIEYEYYQQFSTPIVANYNNTSKVLSITTLEIAEQYVVAVTMQDNSVVTYTIYGNDLTISQDVYFEQNVNVLSASFVDIISEDIKSATIYACSSNLYTINSNIMVVDLI